MWRQLSTGWVLLLITVAVAGSLLRGQAPPLSKPELEVFPKHFLLHPGEQIHYQVLERVGEGQPRNVDATFAVKDPVSCSHRQ